MLGALLALASAASFGLNNATLRRGVLKGTVFQAMAITVPLGVPLFALAALFAGVLGTLGDMSAASLTWFTLAGIIHFVIGRYGNYQATRHLGANLSGPVQQMSVLVSLVLALVFLGETLTPISVVGIVLVIVGPFIMLKGKRPKATASGFEPNYREGLFWGAVSAVGYGVSPLFVAYGIDGAGPGQGLLGGLVSYAAATVVIVAMLALPAQIREMRAIERGPAGWFLVSGVFVFISQAFRYAALALAPVSVVAPIQRLSVVFRVLFAWLINREHEIFGVKILAGILMSLIGALLLGLSVEWVAPYLPAPLAAFIQMSWP